MISLDRLSFGNGAGTIKLMSEVLEASRGPMTRIMVGSITKPFREGNIPLSGVYYYHPTERWSMNSLGLRNYGMDVYCTLLPKMVACAHTNNKELWASISGESPQENAELLQACLRAGVDGVEVNLSCPNVWKGNDRKEIPALNPSLAHETLRCLSDVLCLKDKPVSIKLSPTSDTALLMELAEVIATSGVAGYVTACNTIPDQERFREDGTPALAFRSSESDPVLKHKGGLAGSAVKEITLEVVRILRERLPGRIGIIGVGGIFDADAAYAYLEAGACGFQCTTGYYEQGNKVFEPILQGLADRIPEAA